MQDNPISSLPASTNDIPKAKMTSPPGPREARGSMRSRLASLQLRWTPLDKSDTCLKRRRPIEVPHRSVCQTRLSQGSRHPLSKKQRLCELTVPVLDAVEQRSAVVKLIDCQGPQHRQRYRPIWGGVCGSNEPKLSFNEKQ